VYLILNNCIATHYLNPFITFLLLVSPRSANVAMENDKQEPIAIVGMGCRFPGDADTPNGFWELLSKGESAWSKVPRNRFDIDGFHHPSSDRGGAVSSES